MVKNFRSMTVFDLDKTLAKCNVSYHFGKFLYSKSYFGIVIALIVSFSYGLYKLRGISISKLHQCCYLLIFKNKCKTEINALVEEYLNESFTLIQNEMISQKLHEARKRGEFVVILSSSPCFLVSSFAAKMEVERYLGTPYFPFNKDTIMDGHAKATVIKQWAKERNVDLQNVTFYTDHSVDLPLLKIVGHPIAVKPNLILKIFCYLKGWPIST